jgi:hypothetical protein
MAVITWLLNTVEGSDTLWYMYVCMNVCVYACSVSVWVCLQIPILFQLVWSYLSHEMSKFLFIPWTGLLAFSRSGPDVVRPMIWVRLWNCLLLDQISRFVWSRITHAAALIWRQCVWALRFNAVTNTGPPERWTLAADFVSAAASLLFLGQPLIKYVFMLIFSLSE